MNQKGKKKAAPSRRPKKKTLKSTPHHLQLRNTLLSDYDDIKEIMDLVYPSLGGAWSAEQFAEQLKVFPEGQICIEDSGKVVGAAISMVIDYDSFGDNHTYFQIVGDGTLDNHNSEGETLYGVDLFVHPTYRDMRLGRRLYDARKELCERLNLRRILVGGRIPGYARMKEDLSPRQYISLVKSKEIVDPILTFQLANEFHVRRLLKGYMPGDEESQDYAVLLEWNNISYEDKPRLIGGAKTVVRVGVLQWQMRQAQTFEAVMQQVEYFVDAVSGYNADFVIFPEYFNAPLMAQFNDQRDADAIRSLANFTDRFRDKMLELAVHYNINIIGGSMPEYRRQSLHNVSYLFRRDGTWDAQYKIHVTPDEASCWGLKGGDKLVSFDTDIGKVGILICYDVEFPELSRHLADQGMSILFVPYWTDTKNGYLRVRQCAMARAIENECYVVISGSTGAIPNISNMDIQYSQSAVFCPSDFAFPHDAIISEATPNTETILIADLDLELLKQLRMQGSVRNLRDRRKDLYAVEWKG